MRTNRVELGESLPTVELRDRQATWQGFGDALALGIEMVLTPLLFAAVGWWLDGRFGTGPLLALLLGLLGLAGEAMHVYYTYRAGIARAEEGKPWTRPRP
jgi:F0F1-type ATP synthase assembly protein I